ncbi:MAG: YraN family protein [bacterium]|nr:YraN family protein [bacterium]
MKNSKNIGYKGEDVVCRYLIKNDFLICARNYHSRYGEIDIVAENEKIIIFVEVKTRSKNSISSPGSFVDYRKQQKIIKTANYYLMNNPTSLQPRFDVAEVFTETPDDFKNARINYIENAFGV